MNPEDDLLFDAKPPSAKFEGGKPDAATRKRDRAAVQAMDMADLIGSGESASTGTGLDFGATAPAPQPAAAQPAPQPAPAAKPAAATPASSPKPKATRPAPAAEVATERKTPRVLPPSPRRRGLLGWLLRLFGRG